MILYGLRKKVRNGDNAGKSHLQGPSHAPEANTRLSLDSGRLWKALDRYRTGSADFDDYLIPGHAEAIGAVLQTFDKKLKKEL